MIGRQSDSYGPSLADGLFEAPGQPVLVAPRDETDASCRAHGGIGICLGEFQSLDRQTIDVRRGVVALAVTADIRVAKVIGHNEDNVRLGSLRLTGATKTCQSKRTCGSSLHEPASGPYFLMLRHDIALALI